MTPLVSSNLAGFEYDAETSELTIQFKNGTRYVYVDVPAHVAEELEFADSVGRYFAESIRHVYEGRRK